MSAATDPRAAYDRTLRVTFTIPDAVYRAVAEDYVAKFGTIVREWRRATLALSAVADKIAHPAFQRLVALGEPIVPLIISELRRHPDFLYLALQELVDEKDVVPPAAAANPRANVEAWLNWWERTRGHAD